MNINRIFLYTALLCFTISGVLQAQTITEKTTLNDTNQIASLYIKTDIPKTEVYLNGIYQGLTPLTIKPIEIGIWQLTLRKDGYYQEAYTIRIGAGEEKQINVELKQITGTLIIQNAPPKAEFEIDGDSYTEHILKLTEGFHTISIRAFGFTEKKIDFSINRYTEKIIDGSLDLAPFRASDLRPLKPAFNPKNPANLGKMAIRFKVTSPGIGTVEIVDQKGNQIKIITVDSFTTWKQAVIWDGKTETGDFVSDGTYTVILRAHGLGENRADNLTDTENKLHTDIRIDRSITYPFTESFNGIGSIGEIVSASLMPTHGAMLHFDVLGYPGNLCPGISAVAGITPWLEAGFRAGVLFGDYSESTIDIATGIKAGGIKDSFHYALALRYSAQGNTVSASGPAFRRGISFGPAIEYQIQDFYISANSELTYGNNEGLFLHPFFSAQAGIAFRYNPGNFSGSIWAVADSTVSETMGLSMHYLINGTNLILSAQTGYEIGKIYTDAFFFRGGFGIIF